MAPRTRRAPAGQSAAVSNRVCSATGRPNWNSSMSTWERSAARRRRSSRLAPRHPLPFSRAHTFATTCSARVSITNFEISSRAEKLILDAHCRAALKPRFLVCSGRFADLYHDRQRGWPCGQSRDRSEERRAMRKSRTIGAVLLLAFLPFAGASPSRVCRRRRRRQTAHRPGRGERANLCK